jgi:RNA polymerase sigma-70 factor (ECF subfamily)
MRLSKITDSQLVQRYIHGDERALEELIYRHKTKIYSYIYSKVLDREVSEDIFQETFIKVINTLKRGAYSDEGKFLQWVMRIAHNLTIDYFRRLNKKPHFNESDEYDIFSTVQDNQMNAENKMIWEQLMKDVRNLIDELPDDQKEVLIMRMYKDMSFREISEATGVSINTALGRMRYALINLRKIVDKHNITLYI